MAKNIYLSEPEGEKKGGGPFVPLLVTAFVVAVTVVIGIYVKDREAETASPNGTKVPDMSSLYEEAQNNSTAAPAGNGGTAARESETPAAVQPSQDNATVTVDGQSAGNNSNNNIADDSWQDGDVLCDEVTEESSKANGILALIYKQTLPDNVIEEDQLDADYYRSVMAQDGNALGMGVPYKASVDPDTLDTVNHTVEATMDGQGYLIRYTVDDKNLINGITAERR